MTVDPIALFNVGPLTVYAHTVVLWAGIFICLSLAWRSMTKQEYPVRSRRGFALLAVLMGFVLAHMGYGLVRLGFMLNESSLTSLLAFWQGQYMLYGGMLGCVLAAAIVARLSRRRILVLLDALAPTGALMIAFTRLAQGLSGEGYGDYLEEGSPFARFPFAVYDSYYEAWAWALYLLAALAAALLFVWLLTQKSRFGGDRTLLMLGLYAAMQIVLESMRRDNYLRWGFVRSSQVISAVLVLFVLLSYFKVSHGRPIRRKVASGAMYLAMVGICILLEFAVEQRVPFLEGLTVPMCYMLMGVACVVMMGCILIARSKPASVKLQ